jgi:cell division transport system ATP-binding protein
VIKFVQVTKRFGLIVALEEVSFTIEDGEFVFITGPSGAGKTTLINLILRRYVPTGGSVVIEGADLSKLSRKNLILLRRQIGVVFQDYKLLGDRTVEENVAMALQVLGKKEGQIEKEVKAALAAVGLSERASLFPSQLAGGELQRTCLARAMVIKPKVIIADEPTGNLDSRMAGQIVDLLKKFNKEGRTVIMATHNLELVRANKARVIELDEGKLVKDNAGTI